jgi:deltex
MNSNFNFGVEDYPMEYEEYMMNIDDPNFDYTKICTIIDQKCKEKNNQIQNKNNNYFQSSNQNNFINFNSNNLQENLLSTSKEDDLNYITYLENLKENILQEKYVNKPTFINHPIIKNLNLFNSDTFKKIHSITKSILITPLEVYYKIKYESHNKISHDADKCTICLDNLYENLSKENSLEEILNLNDSILAKFSEKTYDHVVMLEKCSDHFFHRECLLSMIGKENFIKCPVCSKIYGVQTGTQPPGEMTAYIDYHTRCAGFENCNTIVIKYSFPNGHNYTGTSRHAYLPDTLDGRKTLGLLKVCFDRKLIFTVGTSVTTGQTNTTVWAGIHHKTHVTGGTMHFGYPDATYFNRVQQEMASKGVGEDTLDEKPEIVAEKFLAECKNNYQSRRNNMNYLKF